MNNSNIPITKANLQRHAWEDVPFGRANFQQALNLANSILNDTFGLTIEELPPKKSLNDGKKKESKTQQYILVNQLQDPYLKFQLESQWLSKSNALFQSELMEKRHDYRNNKELYPALSTDEDLVFSGLALAIVAIIMVSNNHINQVELIKIMRETFGVDPNTELEVLNITIEEFLKKLDKSDYVNRSCIKNDNEEVVEYSVGRRAKSEFNRESFIAFTQIIYNEPDGSPEFLAQINATIDATFGTVATGEQV